MHVAKSVPSHVQLETSPDRWVRLQKQVERGRQNVDETRRLREATRETIEDSRQLRQQDTHVPDWSP